MRAIGLLAVVATLLAAGCQRAASTDAGRLGIRAPGDRAFRLDGRPYNILHYRGRLYVNSFKDHKLWVLDAASGKELKRFEDFDHFTHKVSERDKDGNVTGRRDEPQRASPGDMAIAGGKLFVEQTFCDSVLVLDAETLHPMARIETGKSGKMVASPDGRELYFARNDESGFSIIDVATYEKKDVAYPMCDIVKKGAAYPAGGRGIGAVAVSPDGKRLYLGIQRGARDADVDPPSEAAGPVNPLTQTYSGPFLAVYNLERRDYVALKSVGDTVKARGDDASLPHAFAFSPDGGTLYIAMRQCMAGVHVFDTRTNELREPITLDGPHDPFPWPNCADIAVRDGKIYVSVESDSEIVVIDAETHRKLRVLTLGARGQDAAGRMAFSADRLFVCQETRCIVLDVDLSSNASRR